MEPTPAPLAAEAPAAVDELAPPAEPLAEIEAEVAPFTPAAIEAEEEAWMPWETPAVAAEDAEAAVAEEQGEAVEEAWAPWEPAPAEPSAPAAGADDLPWLTTEPEPAAAEEPASAFSDAEAAGGTYSFDVESFDEAISDPEAFEPEAVFAPAAEPESIGGELLPYAVDEVAEAEAETAAWEAPAAAHVSEAEAGPGVEAFTGAPAAEEAGAEAWSVEFAVDGTVTEEAAAEEEREPAAGMEDFYAGEANAAAEAALYAPAEGEEEPAPAAEAYAAAGVAPDALAEVADRLEGIARALRERPGDVLAGGAEADPLELLITGFALGYAQGRRRGA